MTAPARRPLVLIVDDDERNAKLAGDVLGAAGFDTLTAATGTAGVALALERRPDVVLMDIRLPDMGGTEAARRLRDDPRASGIPVVALTALPVDGDRGRLLAAGFDGCLEKPIAVRDFPAQVGRFCR